MTSAEKAGLYRELAKMIQADFHLDRSLDLLLKQRQGGRRQAFLTAMQSGLAQGKSVAAAVASAERGEISPLEMAMIEAGERSGRLGPAFAHLTQYFTAVEAARRQSRSAMIYPLILLHLAILLPELPAAITATDGKSPLLGVAIAVGLLWVGILGAVWLWRVLTRLAERSAAVDRALGWLPFIGSMRRHWALARFCQVFHAGLLAALRTATAVTLAGEAAQSGQLRQATRLAATAIESGELVSAALRDTQAFPPAFVNCLATAEAVGGLDTEMERWTVLETDLAADALGRAALWLPKIGYASIAVFVVYRIIGMVVGYYGAITGHFEL